MTPEGKRSIDDLSVEELRSGMNQALDFYTLLKWWIEYIDEIKTPDVRLLHLRALSYAVVYSGKPLDEVMTW